MKKAVIISGGSSGIGEATARIFSENDYHCIILGKTPAKIEKVVASLPSAVGVAVDFGGTTDFAQILKPYLEDKNLEIEALVNNAGIFAVHDFTDQGLALWQNMFQVNLFSTVSLTQALVPYFKARKKGSIVNVSSTLSHKGGIKTTAYSASKAALNNLTVSLALELASHNVRVNCVCPGLVDTPIHAFHGLEPLAKAKAVGNMANVQPLGRIGHPTEIGEAIYFLASDKSRWTTGAILNVDGGINIK